MTEAGFEPAPEDQYLKLAPQTTRPSSQFDDISEIKHVVHNVFRCSGRDINYPIKYVRTSRRRSGKKWKQRKRKREGSIDPVPYPSCRPTNALRPHDRVHNMMIIQNKHDTTHIDAAQCTGNTRSYSTKVLVLIDRFLNFLPCLISFHPRLCHNILSSYLILFHLLLSYLILSISSSIIIILSNIDLYLIVNHILYLTKSQFNNGINRCNYIKRDKRYFINLQI